uniref:Properdin n=1 Tax=Laticauda laticaudata TaxID=8630 RepID=A0A8C5RHV4_LATLA
MYPILYSIQSCPCFLFPVLAENVLCYKTFDEISGTCSNLLGAGVSQEDCCLNSKYGFQLTENGACQSCRGAQWSKWASWSACSVSCTEGVQRRSRICYGYHEGTCPIGTRGKEMKSCLLKECCPVMGGWSEWSAWKPCSVTCQTGTQLRERTCTNPTPVCGGTCTGYSRETKPCDTSQICPTHGNWGSWGPWQPCSQTCSIEGSARQPQQQRSRPCNNPPPSLNPLGKPCPGPSQESKSCTGLPNCPRDGNWGGWKLLQPCTVTCGVGQILQKRLCDNPPPKHGGKNCLGEDVRRQPCTVKVPCPVDGHWDEWGPWKPCSRYSFEIECEEIPASQMRNRKCIGRRYDGKPCEGLRSESRVCYSFEGCPCEYWESEKVQRASYSDQGFLDQGLPTFWTSGITKLIILDPRDHKPVLIENTRFVFKCRTSRWWEVLMERKRSCYYCRVSHKISPGLFWSPGKAARTSFRG